MLIIFSFKPKMAKLPSFFIKNVCQISAMLNRSFLPTCIVFWQNLPPNSSQKLAILPRICLWKSCKIKLFSCELLEALLLTVSWKWPACSYLYFLYSVPTCILCWKPHLHCLCNKCGTYKSWYCPPWPVEQCFKLLWACLMGNIPSV